MESVAVFCGSSPALDHRFALAAIAVGKFNAENGFRTVYGGASVGLMGALAESVVDHGGEIIGIMPEFIEWKEIIHPKLTQFIPVKDMQERKVKMFELSDWCICLPGAYGTLDEMSEWCTFTQLKLHKDGVYKPCGLYNVGGYYNHLIKFLDRNVSDGLMTRENRDIICVSDNIQDLYKKLKLKCSQNLAAAF